MPSRRPSGAELAAFKALDSVDAVAGFLGTTPKRFAFHLYGARRPRYREFGLRKASGGIRAIAAPPPVLAAFQRQLLPYMTALVVPKLAAHGFTSGRSVKTNAAQHVGARLLLNIDLKDFFSSVHFGRVRGVFMHLPFRFPQPVATALAQVCCHNARLPQGAPTSPILTNLICRRLDRDLTRLARRHRCQYTRYADDMTFSTQDDGFPDVMVSLSLGSGGPPTVGGELRRLIEKHDLAVNPSKTRVRSNRRRQTVTGVVVNEKVNLPRASVRRVRALLHVCERDGIVVANSEFRAGHDNKQRRGSSPHILQHLKGKIDYLGMIRGTDDLLFSRLAVRARRLDPGAFPALTIHGKAARDVALLGEALWVVVGRDSAGVVVIQGTAFGLRSIGIVSAAHVFERRTRTGETVDTWDICKASDPAKRHQVRAIRRFSDLDLAILEVDVKQVGCLKQASALPAALDPVFVVGYPVWVSETTPSLATGVVQQARSVSKVRYILTNAICREGMSGGPLLQGNGLVAGVVVYDEVGIGVSPLLCYYWIWRARVWIGGSLASVLKSCSI